MKNFRKSKIFYNSVLATHSRIMPFVSLLRSSRDSLVSEFPNREKHLENFSKFLGFFFSFSQLILAICLRVEAPIASLHRRFRDSLAGGPSSREKDLYKIFKILFKGFWRLAHESADSQKSCVLHK